MRGIRAAEIVEAEPLGSILRKFLDDWEIQYPKSASAGQQTASRNASRKANGFLLDETRDSSSAPYFMGGIQYLAEKSGVNERLIRGIKNNEYDLIPWKDADPLIQAMNLTHYIDLIIQVKPNPYWSMEKYQAYMAERGCI